MYALVCGGSTHFLTPPETAWIAAMCREHGITALIPGGSRLVDAALGTWAQQNGIAVKPIPADWHPGHQVGAIRSAQYLKMLHQHLPGQLLILALPGGEGTAHVMHEGTRLGLPVYVYTQEKTPMPDMMAPPDVEPTVHSPVPLFDDDIPDVTVPDTLKAALAGNAQEGPQESAGDTQPSAAASSMPPAWKQHEALLQGFLGHVSHRLNTEVLEQSKNILDVVKQAIKFIDEAATRQSQYNEHALYQLSDALAKLQKDGLALRHDPYQVTLHARTPEGYDVEIAMCKTTTDEVIQALPALSQWLSTNGYTRRD